jgi:hypothetical protein
MTQVVIKFSAFMKPEGSLSCSQQPATGPYPKPDASSPHLPILFSIYAYVVPAKILYILLMSHADDEADEHGKRLCVSTARSQNSNVRCTDKVTRVDLCILFKP